MAWHACRWHSFVNWLGSLQGCVQLMTKMSWYLLFSSSGTYDVSGGKLFAVGTVTDAHADGDVVILVCVECRGRSRYKKGDICFFICNSISQSLGFLNRRTKEDLCQSLLGENLACWAMMFGQLL